MSDIDEDLLRDIGHLMVDLVHDLPGRTRRRGEALLASEPMRRYVAAQVAEARVGWLGPSAYGDSPISYIRELEAKVAEVSATNGRNVSAGIELAEQRDKARAEVERLRAEVERWKVRDDATSEALRGFRVFGEAYESAIGRLRAAQPVLPDVGPVTRDEIGTLWCDGVAYTPELTGDSYRESARTAARMAARRLAVAAEIDAHRAPQTGEDA